MTIEMRTVRGVEPVENTPSEAVDDHSKTPGAPCKGDGFGRSGMSRRRVSPIRKGNPEGQRAIAA